MADHKHFVTGWELRCSAVGGPQEGEVVGRSADVSAVGAVEAAEHYLMEYMAEVLQRERNDIISAVAAGEYVDDPVKGSDVEQAMFGHTEAMMHLTWHMTVEEAFEWQISIGEVRKRKKGDCYSFDGEYEWDLATTDTREERCDPKVCLFDRWGPLIKNWFERDPV